MLKNIRKPYPWLMIFIAALFYSYEFFLRVSPSVMTKELMHNFNLNAQQIGVISSYYFLAYTPMQLFVGLITDIYKTKTILLLAIISCTLGAWLFFNSSLILNLKIGRLIIGFGSAFAFVLVMKIAANWLDNKYFSIVSGVTTSLGMLGAITGELILAKSINNFGYNTSIGFSIYSGIIIALLTLAFIHNPKNSFNESIIDKTKDLLQALKKLIRNNQIWINAIIGACLYMPTTFFAGQWAISYFMDIYNIPNAQAAFNSSLLFFGWIIGSPLMGVISNKIAKRNILLFIGTAGALITSIILIYIHTSYVINLVLMLLLGIFSSSEILVFAIAHEISPNKLTATAIAITNMIIMLGGFLQPIVGVILDWSSPTKSIPFIESDYQLAFIIIPICFAIGLIFCFFLKETYCKISHD